MSQEEAIANLQQNMDLMARWLNGHMYETKYRPVPIHEHLVYDGKIYAATSTSNLIKTAAQLNTQKPNQTQAALDPMRRIELSLHKEFRDPLLNTVVTLAHETATAGFGVLVFAGSRGICEANARWISRVMPRPHEISPVLLNKRVDLLNDLRNSSTGLDPTLEETVLLGVAFHRESLPNSSGSCY